MLLGNNIGPYAWADGYPLDGTLVSTRWYVQQRSAGDWRRGFGVYQIVRRRDRMVIGDIGFHAAPDPSGSATIGFGLAPLFRGQGFATEALIALTRWALRQPSVSVIVADASADNEKSHGVMMRAGFQCLGEDENLRHYELKAANLSAQSEETP
jgi:RimJ/RimL family protein N-acetyltransferase